MFSEIPRVAVVGLLIIVCFLLWGNAFYSFLEFLLTGELGFEAWKWLMLVCFCSGLGYLLYKVIMNLVKEV